MKEFASDGICVWFTGLPCAGKTTIARELTKRLTAAGQAVTCLDADVVRPVLCPDLGFSREDRRKNLLRIAYVARLLVEHGGVVLVATITPLEEDRQAVRAEFEPSAFLQVFVDTSLEECERRDVKGMYAKARRGILPEFTGVSAPYEIPDDSDVVCRTPEESAESCAARIQAAVERLQWTPQRKLAGQ